MSAPTYPEIRAAIDELDAECRCFERIDPDTGRPGMMPEVVTCGTCGAQWCDRCNPAPSARCHFEAEHDDDDTGCLPQMFLGEQFPRVDLIVVATCERLVAAGGMTPGAAADLLGVMDRLAEVRGADPFAPATVQAFRDARRARIGGES